MMNLLRKIRRRLQLLWYRRNYYWSKISRPDIPLCPLPYLPSGLSVHKVGDTGLRVVDNFVTHEEAQYLINTAREQLSRSTVVKDGKAIKESGRTSSHSVVFHRNYQDPKVLPIIQRGAALAGVPVENAEQIYVSRYGPGELYHGHYDVAGDFLTSHRLCTMLVYLNDLEEDQGGATYFRDLNVAVKPKAGRAVCWTNTNPDGSMHRETLHAALPPVGEGTEKWVIQLWFRPYWMHDIGPELEPLQTRTGVALSGNEPLPPGVFHPG
ncbi:MAG: 2OG-Fe(II) oxygenase [Gammaproteobacteria bacterium]|nr:2OG-Fe(II) oxygenase [Gammaproteobacteria bacterium]NND54176.1 2OG-Fe(II) oxygenase [Gammaproteobacteria bacterium]